MPASACVLVLATVLASPPALADRPIRPEPGPRLHALRFDWMRNGALTASVALTLAGGVLVKPHLAPTTSLLNDRMPDGTDVLNPLDRWGRRELGARSARSRRTAAWWSDTVNNYVLPVGVAGAEYLLVSRSGAPLEWLAEDGLILAESVLLSTLANQVVKFSAGRMRPYVHGAWQAAGAMPARLSVDDRLSFYSGHTNFAFSLVVTAGTLAELRGYPEREWLWAVGLPLALSVPLLRVAADQHYMSDVLVGVLAGSAFGVAVPLLLHGRRQPLAGASMQVVLAPGGAGLVGQF